MRNEMYAIRGSASCLCQMCAFISVNSPTFRRLISNKRDWRERRSARKPRVPAPPAWQTSTQLRCPGAPSPGLLLGSTKCDIFPSVL